MKTKIIPHYSTARVWLVLALTLLGVLLARSGLAGLSGPYTNDFYTLHLWHLQDTNSTWCYDVMSNQNPQITGSIILSNTPGINASAAATDAYNSYTAQSGPSPLYGYTYSIMTTQYSCFYSPWYQTVPPTQTVYPSPPATNICNFVNTNTGAFTFEALVKPTVSLLTPISGYSTPEILCGDNSGSATPPVARGFQFRFDTATPTSGQAEMEFNDILHPDTAGTNHDLKAILPITGPDAVSLGQWYHIAVAYTGSAPTNGDPTNVLTFYWTLFDAGRTNADVLANFPNAFTFTNSSGAGMLNWSPNKLCTGLYPSNSLYGTPFLCVGGSGRNSISNSVASGAGFDGYMAEIRISDCYRHPNEFMFNTSPTFSPPTIIGPATNTLVAFGQTLTLATTELGTQPMTYQWYQITNGLTNAVADQTNATLTITNIGYAANGSYQLLATNAYGNTNSVVGVVTVGAALEEVFNTGCDANNNPLDQTAPGSYDLHYFLNPDADPHGLIPYAVVWGDQAPIGLNGMVPSGASVWIGSEENAGTNATGEYLFTTQFQLDEVDPANATLSGVLYANGQSGGASVPLYLNGVQTSVTLSPNPQITAAVFTITNGFQAGSNTLQFIMTNNSTGPFAFRVQIGTAIGNALTTAPAINNQPTDDTVNYGNPVAFSVVALGAPPLAYQWYSNNVPVAGATGRTLNFAATNFAPSEVVNSQFNANYQVVISNYQGAVTSSVAQLTVNAGLSVVSAGQPIWSQTTNIVVIYSTAVDPVTAAAGGNYSLDNGATVLSANVVASNEVMLTTSVLAPGTGYNLTIQGVDNSLGIVMSPSPTTLAVGIYPAATALWIKADTGVTTDANGVNQWNDLSGNGNNLYQQGGAPYEPQLATNSYLGKPVIRFTGTNETYMYANDSSSLEITGNMSIFAVVQFANLAGGTNGTIVSKTQANKPAPYDYYAGSTVVSFYRGNGTANAMANSYAAPGMGAPHLLDVIMQGTSVAHRLDANTNGGGILTTTTGDTGQPLFIGTRVDAQNRLTGDLAELILIGSALSTNDLAAMENYLVTRYNLPTGTNSYPVLIQSPVASTNIGVGGVLTLPAMVTGSGPLWYQWFDVDNGTNLASGSTNGTALNATLTVSNVPSAWNGDQLELTVSNQFGAANVYVGLNVVAGAPQIATEPPATFFAEAGSSATNSVVALGSFPLSYQWQFYGTNLSDNGRLSGSQGPTLVIADVQAADAGNYQVIVTNIYGSATSTLASLAVLGDQPIGFNDSGIGWSANYAGSAGPPTISANVLTLTDGNNGETRSFFFDYPQYIGGFEASFVYQAGGNMAADGITFCLQNDPRGPAAVGGGGGELAVNGITPSYELEFNIYTVSTTRLGYGVDTNGIIGTNSEPGAINLGSGDPIGVSLYYLPGMLSLTFTDYVAQTSFATNLVVGSLPNILKGSTAYVGFTGSDGGLNSIQTISNFTFVSLPPETIQLTSTSSLISWPGAVQGYLLQENSNLTSGTWITVTNPTAVINGTNQVITPTTDGNMFYRLVLPP
jgi:hypothetical protein